MKTKKFLPKLTACLFTLCMVWGFTQAAYAAEPATTFDLTELAATDNGTSGDGWMRSLDNIIISAIVPSITLHGDSGDRSVIILYVTDITLAAGTKITSDSSIQPALRIQQAATVHGEGAGITISSATNHGISSEKGLTITGAIDSISGGDSGIYAEQGLTITGAIGSIYGGIRGISVSGGFTISHDSTIGDIYGGIGGIISQSGDVTIAGTTGAIIGGDDNGYGIMAFASNVIISGTTGAISGGWGGIITNQNSGVEISGTTGAISGGTLGIAANNRAMKISGTTGTITGGDRGIATYGTAAFVEISGEAGVISGGITGIYIQLSTFNIGDNSVVYVSGTETFDLATDDYIPALPTADSQGILFVGNPMSEAAGTVYGNVTLQGNLTIEDGQTLTVATDTSLTIPNGVTLTNNGTISNDGDIINNGTISNDGDIANNGTISGTGELANNGTINNDGDIINNGTISNDSDIINNGTISNDGDIINSGTISNDSDITNNGTISNNSDIINSGTISNNGDITNSGTISNDSDITNNGTLSNDGDIINNGTISGAGELVNNGALSNDGDITNNGTISNDNDIINNGTISNDGDITNSGTISNNGDIINSGTISNDSDITNSGTLSNDGDIINNGTISNDSDIINNGTISNDGDITNSGTLSNDGDITNSGTISNDGDITNNGAISNNGDIINSGTISNDGDIINNGTISGAGEVVNNGTIECSTGGISIAVTGTSKAHYVGSIVWHSFKATVGEKLEDIDLTEITAPIGAFEWLSPTDLVGRIGRNEHELVLTWANSQNYTPVSNMVTVTVSEVVNEDEESGGRLRISGGIISSITPTPIQAPSDTESNDPTPSPDNIPTWVNIFSDITEGAWYYNAVAFVSERGLFHGYGNGIFAPNDSMTRAMFVTVLHNLEGRPAPSGQAWFTDVAVTAWEHDSVQWAAENGIVSGIGGGLFAPNRPINRQEMASILSHYADHKGIDLPALRDITNFTDLEDVDDWAKMSVVRLAQAGVINGNNNALMPKKEATRAEVAQVFMNFLRVV